MTNVNSKVVTYLIKMSESTHTVILAGGEGTRLRPLTNSLPKPMLPIIGIPCIQYSIEALKNANIKNVHLACGYRSDDLIPRLQGLDLGINLDFTIEQEPAGTAGAVKLLEDRISSTFIVTSGDVLADVDMKALLDEHKKSHAIATIALTEVENPSEFGIVGLDSEGRINRFKEKPKGEEIFSKLINAGIYVLEKDVLNYIPGNTKYDFSKNLFPLLLEKGELLHGARLQGIWKDIGRPSDLLDANIAMAERKGTAGDRCNARCVGRIVSSDFQGNGCSIVGPSYIGKNVVIGKQSHLESCAIGDNSSVGADTYLKHVMLRENCTLGEGCVLENVVLGRNCTVAPDKVIKNSVIGDFSKI